MCSIMTGVHPYGFRARLEGVARYWVIEKGSATAAVLKLVAKLAEDCDEGPFTPLKWLSSFRLRQVSEGVWWLAIPASTIRDSL